MSTTQDDLNDKTKSAYARIVYMVSSLSCSVYYLIWVFVLSVNRIKNIPLEVNDIVIRL